MKNQNGHIYIKINNFFTATVRNLKSLKTILNSNEEKTILEIIEVSNVTKKLENRVNEIIEEYKNNIEIEILDTDKVTTTEPSAHHRGRRTRSTTTTATATATNWLGEMIKFTFKTKAGKNELTEAGQTAYNKLPYSIKIGY